MRAPGLLREGRDGAAHGSAWVLDRDGESAAVAHEGTGETSPANGILNLYKSLNLLNDYCLELYLH